MEKEEILALVQLQMINYKNLKRLLYNHVHHANFAKWAFLRNRLLPTVFFCCKSFLFFFISNTVGQCQFCLAVCTVVRLYLSRAARQFHYVSPPSPPIVSIAFSIHTIIARKVHKNLTIKNMAQCSRVVSYSKQLVRPTASLTISARNG